MLYNFKEVNNMKFELNLKNSLINEKVFEKKKHLKNFESINTSLHSGKEEWTAWVDYPSKNIKKLDQIKTIAKDITKNGDVLVVLGIGGSYLGAFAGLTALKKDKGIDVVFAGINFSNEEIETVFNNYKNKNVYVNVISKSGTTTETMIAFEYALAFLKKKYGKEYKNHLIITTDKEKGYLRDFVNKNNITSLEVPDNMGGRFSVLSGVGLLPLACGGVDIDALMKGALTAEKDLASLSASNPAYRYALTRYLLNKKGKSVEVLASFYARLSKIGAWWTQLFAESEGKQGKGLFVSSLNYSTDLHSVGQYVQQGTPLLFETFLSVNNVAGDRKISKVEATSPIKYLEGKTVEQVNLAAEKGTMDAHISAKVPVLQITIDKVDEMHIGYLFYFFELSCAISGKLLGINPFDQPGVEDYKRNMKNNLKN